LSEDKILHKIFTYLQAQGLSKKLEHTTVRERKG